MKISPRARHLALALVLLIGGSAIAAPPQPIIGFTSKGSLTTEDKQEIENFAKYWGPRLEDRDPAVVMRARDELWTPLVAPGVTAVFRREFGRALRPILNDIVEQSDAPLSVVNGLQIGALLYTDGAMDLMMRHVHPDDEELVIARLWAARGAKLILIDGTDSGILTQRRANRAIRDLGRAARAEDQWPVLRWQLDAIIANETQAASDELIKTLEELNTRLESESEANDLMKGIAPVIVSLRDRFIRGEWDPRSVGPEAVTQLARLLEIGERHWDTAQERAELKAAYSVAIGAAENTIGFIGSNTNRPIPPTGLKRSFDSGSRDNYRSDLAKITESFGN